MIFLLQFSVCADWESTEWREKKRALQGFPSTTEEIRLGVNHAI
jgi:hypothetical protein